MRPLRAPRVSRAIAVVAPPLLREVDRAVVSIQKVEEPGEEEKEDNADDDAHHDASVFGGFSL